jgi:hypothetical protein
MLGSYQLYVSCMQLCQTPCSWTCEQGIKRMTSWTALLMTAVSNTRQRAAAGPATDYHCC